MTLLMSPDPLPHHLRVQGILLATTVVGVIFHLILHFSAISIAKASLLGGQLVTLIPKARRVDSSTLKQKRHRKNLDTGRQT